MVPMLLMQWFAACAVYGRSIVEPHSVNPGCYQPSTAQFGFGLDVLSKSIIPYIPSFAVQCVLVISLCCGTSWWYACPLHARTPAHTHTYTHLDRFNGYMCVYNILCYVVLCVCVCACMERNRNSDGNGNNNGNGVALWHHMVCEPWYAHPSIYPSIHPSMHTINYTYIT